MRSYGSTRASAAEPKAKASARQRIRRAEPGLVPLTKPFTFSGQRLSVNFATSAAGSLHVELTDAQGQPLSGFSLADSDENFGDSLDRTVTWKEKSDVSSLAGKPVRLRFALRDAEVYAFQFQE